MREPSIHPTPRRYFLWGLWIAALAAFALMLLMEVAVLLYLAPKTITEIGSIQDPLYLLLPFPTTVASATGAWLSALFVSFAGAIIASAAYMLARGCKSLKLRKILKVSPHSPGALGMVCLAFLMLLIADLVYYALLGTIGVEPYQPPLGSYPAWELTYIFAKASVYEELVSRVLLIGVPLALLSLARKRPRAWRLLLGRTESIGRIEIVLGIGSAALFGIAHAQGWDWYKVPPAFLAGLFFSHLFLKHGLPSCIVLHFAIDFLGMVTTMMPEDLFALLGTSVLLIWFLAGFAYLLDLVVRWVVKRVELLRPPVHVTQSALFTCPACGSHEAIYAEQKLICTACGREYPQS
ncbi:MAG: CPBP family intramembrane glutamic endopeptidase [Candidatus Thermoplasmatota archaeon]